MLLTPREAKEAKAKARVFMNWLWTRALSQVMDKRKPFAAAS